MRTRAVLWSLLTALTSLGGAAWMTGAPANATAPEFTASVVCAAPQTSVWGTLLEGFKQDVTARTGGRVLINLTFGASAGAEVSLVQGVLSGAHQGGAFSTAALAQGAAAPRVAIGELPYLFQNLGEVDHILDNVVKTPLSADLHAKGLTFGAWGENGWLDMAARTQILKTPAQFAGVPLRHQPSTVHQSILAALGAAPQSLSLDQVGPQLTGGSSEGLSASVQYLEVAGWSSIQKVSQTHHAFQPAALVWANSFWDTLPPDLQAELTQAQATLTTSTRTTVRAREATAIAALQGQGVTFQAVTVAEKNALKQVLLPTHQTFSQQSPQNAQLLQTVVSALSQLRGGN